MNSLVCFCFVLCTVLCVSKTLSVEIFELFRSYQSNRTLGHTVKEKDQSPVVINLEGEASFSNCELNHDFPVGESK